MCSLFIEQAEALFPSIHRLRVQFKNAWFVAEVVMGQKGTNTNPPPEEVTKATTQIPQFQHLCESMLFYGTSEGIQGAKPVLASVSNKVAKSVYFLMLFWPELPTR